MDDLILSNQQNVSNFQISYHLTQADADSDLNAIDKSDFSNANNPFEIELFARIENSINTSCSDTSISFKLLVNTITDLNLSIDAVTGCDFLGNEPITQLMKLNLDNGKHRYTPFYKLL